MPEAHGPLRETTALVTGASRRLGRAIAERLGQAGAAVAVHYRRDARGARETVAALEGTGVRALALQADLTSAEEACALVARTEEGLGPIDLLVNNAATFRRTPVEIMTVEDFDEHMAANARSVYVLSLEVGRRQRSRGRGAIVNLADVAGVRPWPAFVPYSASKAAVISLTVGMARALAPEVRVNAVAPGPILPPAGEPPEQGEQAVARTLLRRWGSPADVANAVLYLATAEYVTGVVLPVDGGRSVAG